MPVVVVLGTGTGVGKTYVTAALTRALVLADPTATVLALKPIETGIRRRNAAPPPGSDAATLEAVSRGRPQRPHPLYAFHEPISPHLAARQAAARISIPALLRWVRRNGPPPLTLPRTTLPVTTWILVETAGGALSPLTAKVTNGHFAKLLDPAIWVLVAPDSLGVFHDIRATLLGLRSVAREPDYLVLSRAREPDASTGSNAAELRRIGLPRPIAVVGRHADPSALSPLVRALLRHATPPKRRR